MNPFQHLDDLILVQETEQMDGGINPATDAAYVHAIADRFHAGESPSLNDDSDFAAIANNSSLTSLACVQRFALQIIRNGWRFSAIFFAVLAIGVGCFVCFSPSPVLEITGSGLSVTDRTWIQSQCANAADLDRLANLIHTNAESGSATTEDVQSINTKVKDYDQKLLKLSQAWGKEYEEIQERADKMYTELKENYRSEVDSLTSTIKDLRDSTIQNVDSVRNNFGKYVATYSDSMKDLRAQIAELSKMRQNVQTNSERDQSFDDNLKNMKRQYSDMEDRLKVLKEHTIGLDKNLTDALTHNDVLKVVSDFHKTNSHKTDFFGRTDIRKVIHEFYEGKDPEIDYALQSNGASVSAVKHGFSDNKILDFIFRPPRDTAITPVTASGVCFALEGTNGTYVIKLRTYISPTRIMYEHALNTPITTSMPRHFKVYGVSDQEKSAPYQLHSGTFEYKRDRMDYEHIQGFDLNLPSFAPKGEPQPPNAVNVIKIEIKDNYGLPNYTCLYRFRVYGNPCKTC
eukprot:195340_1